MKRKLQCVCVFAHAHNAEVWNWDSRKPGKCSGWRYRPLSPALLMTVNSNPNYTPNGKTAETPSVCTTEIQASCPLVHFPSLCLLFSLWNFRILHFQSSISHSLATEKGKHSFQSNFVSVWPTRGKTLYSYQLTYWKNSRPNIRILTISHCPGETAQCWKAHLLLMRIQTQFQHPCCMAHKCL